MDDRHLHFNILSGLWLVAFLLFILPPLRWLIMNFHIPGLTELWVLAFGSV